MRRILATIALAATIGSAVAAVADEPQRGGELNYGTVTEVSSLDPHVYVGSAWKVLNMALYDTLVTFDGNGKLVPSLAESWDQPDAKTIIFHLRSGVKFHQGQDFSAEDVKFTIERLQDEATAATLRPYVVGVSVEIVDPLTVKLTTPEPDATLLSVLAMPEAAIVDKAWMEAKPNVKVEANGTGPFKLAKYEPSVQAVLERNPDYFRKGQPYLDRVRFQMIKDAGARVNALRSGSVDMIDFVPWKDIDQLAATQGIKVQSAGGSFMNLWTNATKPPFDDPRVRRAVAYAIDREAVSKGAFFGHGSPLYGPPTPPDSRYYHEDLAHTFSYDPDKARTLLEDAGHGDGLHVNMIVYNGLPIYTTTAQILQANLKKVGIDADIKLVEWADVISRKNKGNYDLMVYGVNVKLPDPDVYSYYFGADSTYWAAPIGFKDDELQSLLQKGRTLTAFADRDPVYRQVEQRVLDLSPWIFVNWREQAQAYKSSVHGYKQLGGALSEASPGIALPTLWIEH